MLCTDDPGVFATSLSREYTLAAAAFSLTEAQLRQLALAAAGCTFLPPAEQAALRMRMEAALPAQVLGPADGSGGQEPG